MGIIIDGIYRGMRNGYFDIPSDFESIFRRKIKSALEMIRDYKN
jgi:hypothetical protein